MMAIDFTTTACSSKPLLCTVSVSQKDYGIHAKCEDCDRLTPSHGRPAAATLAGKPARSSEGFR